MAIAHGLDRLALWARRAAPLQMSATRITTLDTLSYVGPLRISELAEREGMTQPGMTILVNRLCEAGFAERFGDPTDGRATLVRILPAGGQVLVERHAARAGALRAVIDTLPAEHQAALNSALEALHALTQTTPRYEKSDA